MDMDEAYQSAVDEQANYLLHTAVAILRDMPQSGNFVAVIADRPVNGTWDHITMPDGIHQIVYRVERTGWITLSLYFNGVKVLPNGEVQLLNTQELGFFEL